MKRGKRAHRGAREAARCARRRARAPWANRRPLVARGAARERCATRARARAEPVRADDAPALRPPRSAPFAEQVAAEPAAPARRLSLAATLGPRRRLADMRARARRDRRGREPRPARGARIRRLHALRSLQTATNPVPGEGNPNADFMCVGEAPGRPGGRTGRPFVGPAGQLLTKILQAVDFSREEVFICNVLKHRPPGNRNPLPDEVIACRPISSDRSSSWPQSHPRARHVRRPVALETKLSIGKLRG